MYGNARKATTRTVATQSITRPALFARGVGQSQVMPSALVTGFGLRYWSQKPSPSSPRVTTMK